MVMTDNRPDPCDQNLQVWDKEAQEEEAKGGVGNKRPGGTVADSTPIKRPKDNTSTGAVATQESSQVATKSDDAPVDIEE